MIRAALGFITGGSATRCMAWALAGALAGGTALHHIHRAAATRTALQQARQALRVQSSKQWRGKVAWRDVPMRPEVHQALADYLATRAMLPTARLFPFMDEEGAKDQKTVSQRLSARYRLAFEYAGCDDLREHDLRHEATCRWLELRDASGHWMFRLEEVNRIMGWSATSTMAQRYASFRGADLAQRLWALPEEAAEKKQRD